MTATTVEPSRAGAGPRAGVAARVRDEVAGLDDDALVARSRELAGEISAAEANLAVVLAEIERRGLHGDWECASVERFAGWHCQLGAARSAGLVEVGRRMVELPVLAEAVSDGSLGFDKARSIARVAEPSTEAALVEMALHATTNQTQRLCGKFRKITDRDATDPDAADGDVAGERPTVIVVRDEDGIQIRARFDHVRGELALAALDTATGQVRRERRDAAPPPGAEANPADGHPGCVDDVPVEKLSVAEWRAEGLLRLAGAYGAERPEGLTPAGLDTTVVVHVGIDTLYGPDMETEPVSTDTTGTTSADVRPGSDPPDGADPPSRGARATAWSVPPPAETPIRATRDEMCELEPSGVRIRRDIARMLACDADILTVIEDADGNPLHLGRRRSTIPARLRRAVMARHRTCAWPGCTATAVQLHHIHHRSDGGHDDVEALVPECLAHHRAIHAHGIWITRDPDGTFHHHRPDGTEILANPTGAADTDALTAPARLQTERVARGGDPHQTSRQPRWQGDPLRIADAVDALIARRDAALRRTRPSGAPPDTATAARGAAPPSAADSSTGRPGPPPELN